MFKRIASIAAVVLCLGAPVQAKAADLIVSAAASLNSAFTELSTRFKAKNPTINPILNFGASGKLLTQIAQGAPADIFASADQERMDKAVEQKLIVTPTRRDFVSNTLVLVLPKDSKHKITDVKALLGDDVKRLAIGNPETVPAGSYARQSMEHYGIWDKLSQKLVMTENVKQALDYVARGEVDAGIVFGSDAFTAEGKVQKSLTLEGHQAIKYPVAVVAASTNKEAAQLFIDFILSPEGQSVMQAHGFSAP